MPILERIISGGQTGADRAALDTAIKFCIPHGGWIANRQNVLDSEGTLIVSRGPLTGGSQLTYSYAKTAGKPVCHIDLLSNDIFEAALIVHSFILENYIGVLNVAGPRASHDPNIYFDVKSVIESTLYLMFLDRETVKGKLIVVPETAFRDDAATLSQAVEWIMADLSLKDKTAIARMDDGRLGDIYFSMMDYIRHRTGVDNKENLLYLALANACQGIAYTPEDAVMDIVKGVRKDAAKHYGLRVLP